MACAVIGIRRVRRNLGKMKCAMMFIDIITLWKAESGADCSIYMTMLINHACTKYTIIKYNFS